MNQQKEKWNICEKFNCNMGNKLYINNEIYIVIMLMLDLFLFSVKKIEGNY